MSGAVNNPALAGMPRPTRRTDVPTASTTVSGISERATQAEVDTGTDTGRHVTPETLAGLTASANGTSVESPRRGFPRSSRNAGQFFANSDAGWLDNAERSRNITDTRTSDLFGAGSHTAHFFFNFLDVVELSGRLSLF